MLFTLNDYRYMIRGYYDKIYINYNKPTVEILDKSDVVSRLFDLYKWGKKIRVFNGDDCQVSPIVTIILENKNLIREYKQLKRKRAINKIIG